MFHNHRRFSAACYLLVVGLMFHQPSVARAQIASQLSEKPIAIFYGRNISEKRMAEYVISLTERMDFAEEAREDLADSLDKENETEPGVPDPVVGYAAYLVSGPIPDLEFVSFYKVNDAAHAKRLLEAEWKDHKGSSVKDMGDECFVAERRRQSTRPLPNGADEAKIAAGIAMAAESNGVTQASYEVNKQIEEQDGKKVVVETTTQRSFYRLYDQFLYEGDSDKLFSMTLPVAADISAGVNESNDLGFRIFLDHVPRAVRQQGWNMVSSGFGMQMQQHDGETDTSYNMRRASGDVSLAIVNAALFDVDFTDGLLKFATEDTPSVEGSLRIRARNNSGMSDKLQRALGDSRFAAILHDAAVVTNHACIRFPEETSKALTATGDWIREMFAEEFGADPAMMTAAETLAETLTGMAEHRNLELLFKVGWTEESAGVIYGGIQLHDNPQLLPTIHQFIVRVLTELAAHPALGFAPNDELIELISDGDVEFIRILLPDDMVDGISESCGARITHLYLAHQNSCLWFAAGGENAKEIIRLSVARCYECNASRTPFVSSRIDMEKWLAYPQDDPVGIAQMPHWLDSNSWLFPPNPFLILTGEFDGSFDRKPQSIMQRAFDVGGSQQFSLTLNADESGLLLQMSLGEALANHMLARLIDMEY